VARDPAAGLPDLLRCRGALLRRRREHEPLCVLASQPVRAVSGDGAGNPALSQGDRALGRLPRLWRGRAAADGGRGARLRRRRQPALARARSAGAAAIRTDEADHRAGAGELLQFAPGGRDRRMALDPARGRADRGARRAGDHPARSRHRAGDLLRRRLHDLPCGPADALVRRRRGRSGGDRPAGLLLRAARLSAQPRAGVPRSRERSARHRLSHHPVQDRDRFGRDPRQGLR